MQSSSALKPHPIGLGRRPLARAHSRVRPAVGTFDVSDVVAAKGSKPAPPPTPPPPTPQDIPAYFQPAPVVPPQQQGQVYQAAPQPQYAPAPAPEPSMWAKIPPLVYIGVGVVLAGVLGKVMELVKGGPQKMQEMAMQQMMKQMMKQMGAPPGAAGANPFAGMPGGSPFGGMPGGMPGGANPFGGAAGAPNPFGAPPSSGFPGSAVFDTTATAAAAAPAAPAAAPPSSSAAPPSSSSAGGGEAEKPKKRSAFADVTPGASTSTAAASSSTAAAPEEPAAAAMPPPFTMPPGGMPPPFNMPPPPPGAGAPTGAGGVAGTMLDMLKNPEMQKMLYPYLPEPMRNQETFEWMLNNPEYRQQLEGMLQQQVASSGSPAMQEMMAGMDMSPEKMNAQFNAMGMTPDQFISKVMSDPDLAGMMTNPKVMAAIAECTKNPMAIFNYQNDPEVLRVFEKMSTLFPQAAGAGALPTMPPGFGAPPQQQ